MMSANYSFQARFLPVLGLLQAPNCRLRHFQTKLINLNLIVNPLFVKVQAVIRSVANLRLLTRGLTIFNLTFTLLFLIDRMRMLWLITFQSLIIRMASFNPITMICLLGNALAIHSSSTTRIPLIKELEILKLTIPACLRINEQAIPNLLQIPKFPKRMLLPYLPPTNFHSLR